MMLHIRPHHRLDGQPSRLEDLLRAIGVHANVAEQLAGDLVEAYQQRLAAGSRLRATAHVAGELVRSLPHLAWGVMRDGAPAERARLAALVTAPALLAAAFMGVSAMQKGPPARLMFGGAPAGRIVVNHRKAARLPLRAVDARGRALDSVPIIYQWLAGAPLAVSGKGVVTCLEAGDAVVRASAGGIAQQVQVRCRPVQNLEALSWVSLLVGEAPRKLSFGAVGLDGRPVTELRGILRVRDSSIASLSGVTVTPLKSGKTDVLIDIGGAKATIHIHVRELVDRFTGLGPDQRSVAVQVRLAPGDSARIALPLGTFRLTFMPSVEGGARPTMMVDGGCAHGDPGQLYALPWFVSSSDCRVDHRGGYVVLTNTEHGTAALRGVLALEFIQPGER
jgi:hypothetical protein